MRKGEEFKPLEVELRKDESIEKLIKRFLKKCKKDGILEVYRQHVYFKKPSTLRREKEIKRQYMVQRENEERKLKEEKN